MIKATLPQRPLILASFPQAKISSQKPLIAQWIKKDDQLVCQWVYDNSR